MNTSLHTAIENILPQIRAIRRDLHAHPQTAFQETYAADIIRRELTAAGIDFVDGIAETGIVGWILPADPQAAQRDAIALRADMDALDMLEENDFAHASTTPGCMHGCGHDGHVAMLLGAARILAAHAEQLPRPVKLLFQPAEETASGARQMVQAGVLTDAVGPCRVGAAFALHGYPQAAVGEVELHAGPAHAGVDRVIINVEGDGAHGAMPHLSRDPVAAAIQIAAGLQTIVSRNVPPAQLAVLSVTRLRAGDATNVIPAAAEIGGTIRWFDEGVGELIRRRIVEVATHTAAAMNCTARVVFDQHTPPVVNAPAACDYFRRIVANVCGPEAMQDHGPSMGAEDFCYFTQAVCGCIVRLGVRPPEAQSYPSLHNPRFDFNDDALPVGIAVLCELALQAETLPARD